MIIGVNWSDLCWYIAALL